MLKKVIGVLIIAFIAYYLLKSPVGAADSVKQAGSAVVDAFSQIQRFFDRLVS